MDTYKLFIDGDFVEAQSGETFESVDPGTGAVIARVAGRARPTPRRRSRRLAAPSTTGSGAV